MPFSVLQPSPCAKACSNCPNALRNRLCDGRSVCSGYGTRANCPPLIVLAVLECALLALAATGLPAALEGLRGAHA